MLLEGRDQGATNRMAGDGGREQKAGHAAGGNAAGQEAPANADPQRQHVQMLIRAARRFNEAHADLASEFATLTGIDPKDFRAVRAWQLKHKQRGDGKIGPATLKAAKEQAGAEKGDGSAVDGDKASGAGGEKKDKADAKPQGAKPEPAEDSAADEGGAVMGNPNLMDNITDGATGEEKREAKPAGEKLEDAGGAVQDAGEGLHHLGGIEEQPWLKAAMAPAIIEQLREGDYLGAAKALAKTFSPSEYIEGLTMACEKLGLDAGVKFFAKFAAIGAELNVTLEMVMWTYEGLHAIAEAHEKGDRDSRISIYASAFADGFLYGEKAPRNGGAVTAEQREADERGHRDGVMTAGRTGEMAAPIAKELLRRYGDAKNARQAIIDELLAKAGFTGIKTHAGT